MPRAKKKARKSTTKESKRQRVLRDIRDSVVESGWEWSDLGPGGGLADYNDDEEIALELVSYDPRAFRFVSARLRNDGELALLAVKTAMMRGRTITGDLPVTNSVLDCISDELKDDFEFGKALLSHPCMWKPADTSLLFGSLSDRLRGNREFVLLAVGLYGRALEHASQELRGDRELVLTAMASTESALQFASPELRGDKELVLKAIKDRNNRSREQIIKDQNKWIFRDHRDPFLVAVSEELRDDREVLEAILPKQDYEIFHASDRLQNCPSLLALALKNVPKGKHGRYNNNPPHVQKLVEQPDRCLVLKNRLAKLEALLLERDFPTRRYPYRLIPSTFADRMEADLIHRTWLMQQVVSAHQLPCELADRIYAYSASGSTTTMDDYHLAKEIRSLGPFLKAGADKFSPPYDSWLFLLGQCTAW